MKKIVLSFLMAVVGLTATAQAPAFPGAEGHGRYVTGGRASNGTTNVYHVKNLQDSGTGSLRWALSQTGPRTIVFDVAGVIALKSDLNIPANTTIAGQTAPSPGITLRYFTVNPNGNNIIVRFIRFRRGQEKDVNDGADASTARHFTGIILDHCSFSWSIDEVASFYDNNNFTMQWCTLGESLNNAGHGKGAHGYGGIWGGKLASFHHNMICHVNNRSPRFNGARYNWTGYTGNKRYSEFGWKNAVQSENVDFRNCVIYNCGNGCYGGPGGGQVNMVNNFYKSGPAGNTTQITTASVANSTTASGYETYWTMFSRYYISGNQIDNTTNAGWDKVSFDSGTKVKNGVHYTPDPNHYYGSDVTYENIDGTDCVSMVLNEPIDAGIVTTHTAVEAFNKVMLYGGASLHRDNVDKRYMSEAKNGTATYSGSVTKKPGRIDLVSDVNGYTEANFGMGVRDSDFDTDKDGISDAWEDANGLDKNDASDATKITLDAVANGGKGWYSNLEIYLNSLVQDIMQQENMDAESSVDEYYPAFVKPDDPDTPDVPTVNGSVVWEFNTGAAEQKATYNTEYFSSDEVTIGSHLKYNGTKTSDIKMTVFTITDETQDTEANDGNAVKFSFTLNNGYQFIPTNVAFSVTRFGTNSGTFSSYLLTSDNQTITVCGATEAYRDNGKDPSGNDTDKHNSVDIDINDADAMTGTNALIINLFNIPYNTNTKNMGLADIAISGNIITPTGVSIPVTISPVMSTEYFNIAGQRVGNQAKGIVIMKQRLENGQVVTKKVMK